MRKRRFLKNVDPITITDNVTTWPPTTPPRVTADGGPATMPTPAPWEATTSGLETSPRTARTLARWRLIDPSQVTEVGGGNDINEVISLSDQADVTVTVPAGEETPKPRHGDRSRRKPSYLKDYVEK